MLFNTQLFEESHLILVAIIAMVLHALPVLAGQPKYVLFFIGNQWKRHLHKVQ